jgi:hypothetical protein
MDSTILFSGLVLVLILLAWYLLARLQPKAPGTYGDPRLRNQGTIAHTERTYTDSSLTDAGERAAAEQRPTAEGLPVDEYVEPEAAPATTGNGRHETNTRVSPSP